MMRWNGIGRTTDYGSSSFVVHLPSSKEKETAAEKGKTRRRRRRGRDWTRMGRGMIRKFFSAEIEAVRSFRYWEHKLEMESGAGGGRRTMEWRLSLAPPHTLQ